MANLTDLNPEFLPLLNAYTSALGKAGIGYRVESGYRSPEQQAEIYARSNQGRSFAAAPPWRSFHNYGFAADVIPNNPADYARMHDLARQAGLYDAQGGLGFTGYDPPHVEMPGSLSNLIGQYHLANWRPASMPAPATGAIAYAGPSGQPSRVATIRPGTTLNSSPLDIVLQAESGDRNINNTHATTSSGQAQGNAQITTGTWNDFAPKAGIDLRQYPTPDSAPRDVQIKVASTIPLNRWAASTVNAVLAKYPGIDTSQTLGAIQSAAINPSGASTAVAGGPAAPAAPGQPGQAPFGSAGNLPGFEANSPGAKMTAEGLKTLGLGGGKPAEPPPMPSAPSIPTAQAMGGPMMMGAGGQNMQGRLAAMNALQQQGYMVQPSLAAFTPPGTTLNSPSQLQQMALQAGQMKSPYDVYANAAYYGGGSGSA